MSVCGSCPLYSNETCEGGRRGAEICQERLFDYIDELDSKLSQYINGNKHCPNCGQKIDWS